MPREPAHPAYNQYTTETPDTFLPQSIGFASALPEQGRELWLSLGSFITQVDMLIEKVSVTLLNCQPYAPGRITIAWWKRDGVTDEDDRSPTPVIWFKRADGVWFCKEIPKRNLANRAKKTGAFSVNYRQTSAALSQLSILFDLRSRAMEVIRLEKIRINALIHQTQDKLDGVDMAITQVMADLIEKKKSRAERKESASNSKIR